MKNKIIAVFMYPLMYALCKLIDWTGVSSFEKEWGECKEVLKKLWG